MRAYQVSIVQAQHGCGNNKTKQVPVSWVCSLRQQVETCHSILVQATIFLDW
jgi:hypothetical protein